MTDTAARPVGIEKIAAYPCSLRLDLATLARERGVAADYPARRLRVTARSLNPPWEDPVTMAVNAALRLLDDGDRQRIGLVAVGTESSPDFAKPIATYVQRHCGIGGSCRTFEVKHACYGSTAAMMMAANWVASGANRGAKALVVSTDQSRLHLGKPWEYVLGAAAVALLISDEAQVLELELERTAFWSREIADTYRPSATAEVGHADTGLFGYLETLEHAYAGYRRLVGEFDYTSYFRKHVYHVPFGDMSARAHRALLRLRGGLGPAQMRRHFETHVQPGLAYTAQCGGTYGSSTFLALMGLVDTCPDLAPGDRLSVFAYGSGSCGEFYSARLGPGAHQAVAAAGLPAQLAARQAVDVATYEALETERATRTDQADVRVGRSGLDGLYQRRYEGRGLLVLDGVEGYRRCYRLS